MDNKNFFNYYKEVCKKLKINISIMPYDIQKKIEEFFNEGKSTDEVVKILKTNNDIMKLNNIEKAEKLDFKGPAKPDSNNKYKGSIKMNKNMVAKELIKIAKSLLSEESKKEWSKGEWETYKKEHPDTKIKPKFHKPLEHEKPAAHHVSQIEHLSKTKSNEELDKGSKENKHLSQEAFKSGDFEGAKHHDTISKQHDVAHHLKNNPRLTTENIKPLVNKMFHG